MASNDAASGAGYQDEYWVGAYYLAALLARDFTPGNIGKVSKVEYQRGPLGDVVVHGNSASGKARLHLQVKRRLQISARHGDFRKVIHQMWKTVNDEEFKKGTDRYGLAVMNRSKPLQQLGKVAERAAACDTPTPFWTAIDDLNKGQKKVLNTVVDVLKSMGIPDINVKDAAWRVLGSGMVVIEINPASAEGPDRARMRSWIDSRVRSLKRTESIVDTLYTLSSQLDTNRGSLSRVGLERRLTSKGYCLTSSPSSPVVVTQENIIDAQLKDINEKLDQLRHEKALPDPVRAAIAQLQLDDLTELLKAGRAKEAFDFAIQHTEKIDAALTKENDPEGLYAEEFRTHRQRLLFAAASAASWRGDIETGRTCWRRAHDLGPIDPECHKQAADALFNVGLADDLRHLMSQMDQESEVYQRTVPLLAFLDGDWETVDEQLVGAESADVLLMRAHARVQILDPQDVQAVQMTADLIDQTEGNNNLSAIDLFRAQETFNLLERVVEEYTPLTYNRQPLVGNLTRRVVALAEATQSDSPLQARVLGILADTAKLLHDEALADLFKDSVEALDDETRSRGFYQYDSPPAPEEIDGMVDAGQIDSSKAAILKSTYYNSLGQPDEAERVLREALFATSDERQRAHVLRRLAGHLRRQKRDIEAQTLIKGVSLRPPDRWLFRAEGLPKGSLPADMIDEVEDFALDVNVLAWLAQTRLSLAFADVTSPKDATDVSEDLADDAVVWAARLVEVLPSRFYRLCYAKALYVARRYDDLLAACQDIDPIYDERIVELKASALMGLGRISEAADLLIAALTNYPDSESIAIHASTCLLTENRPAEAAQILEPRVTAGSKEPDILINFARSLLIQYPRSQGHSSRAFDLYTQAYDLHPNPEIAGEAWMAARGASREEEAGQFFAAMTEGTPHATVKTADDIDEILRTKNQVFIHLEGGIEALAESMRRDQERIDGLNKLSMIHMAAYGDLFRLGGRPWENWARRTQRFEQLKTEDPASLGAFSILADWPSQANRPDDKVGVFADMTAILTLGVLGPDITQQILGAVGKIYVPAGTLNSLHEEKNRIGRDLLLDAQQPYAETARILRGMDDAIIPYTEEIEDASPNAPALGAYRVDIGAAIIHNAFYVTDLDDIQEWPSEIRQRTISPAALLAVLNAAGVITSDEARRAAEQKPDIFGGWECETIELYPPTLKTLVFSEFTLMDWVDAELTGVLGNRLKVGPWCWKYIADAAEHREALVLAHKRLEGIITALEKAADTSILVEIEAVVGGTARLDDRDTSDENSSSLETAWSHALQSLRTAQKHGLQLWADDRFYSLLLGLAGPTVRAPEIEEIRESFAAWAETNPPVSTMELLARLSGSGHLPQDIAQNAAAKLFEQGYRMAHPILLGHALRQFPTPPQPPLTLPFQHLVDAVAEIPHYLPDMIDPSYRMGVVRLASAKVAGRFIEDVWQAPSLSEDQRRTLADAFLDALEDIFKHESATPTAPRSDRTALFFWMEIGKTLQLMPAHDSDCAEIKNAALHWFGHAVARRTAQRQDIVRLLEDSILTFIELALEAFKEIGEKDQLPQSIRQVVIPPLIPLTGTDLLNTLNPLLRRTIGTLISLREDGRVDAHCDVEVKGENIQITVPEEDNEQAAAGVLRRAVKGDMVSAQRIHATDVVFKYIHPVSEEWINAGVPPEVEISINVRCSLFALLWADPPDLRKVIVGIIIFHLAPLDPALAHRIVQLEADLTCNEKKRARAARDKLAVDLLMSGYFDLQRDLTHAVWRFRNYDTDKLFRFVGGIGEETAQILASHPSTQDVRQVGAFLVPQHHDIARLLLGDHDDEAFVREAIERLTNPSDRSNEEGDTPLSLADWLTHQASVAETTDDPFIAASALHQILLVLSAVDENPSLYVGGRTINSSNWVIDYMGSALNAEVEKPSPLEQRMTARRRLASAALQLAAFAYSGEKHSEVHNAAEDPLAEWLNGVWLLASKLQIAIVRIEGGLANAVAAATKAVQELGLAMPSFRALDAFDPYAFGVEGDDIGIALTLTAMLKVLRRTEGRTPPPWWTDTIQDRIENLAAAPPPDIEGIGNRLGLAAPLRVQTLAQRIMEIIRENQAAL